MVRATAGGAVKANMNAFVAISVERSNTMQSISKDDPVGTLLEQNVGPLPGSTRSIKSLDQQFGTPLPLEDVAAGTIAGSRGRLAGREVHATKMLARAPCKPGRNIIP
jgi:hypothetical protein